MENKTYTENEVLILLEKQRKECYKKAKIKCAVYNNPYSNSNGQRDYYVDRDSVLDAKIELI